MTLPKGWKNVTLGEIADVRDGTHDSPAYTKTGYPLLTSKNFKNGTVDLSDIKFISKEDFDSINKRSAVHVNDIIMPMIGTIGNPILITEEPVFAIKNVALIKSLGKMLNVWCCFLLRSVFFQKYIVQFSKGATQKFLSLKSIRNFSFYLPPLPEQKRIVERIERLFDYLDQQEKTLKQQAENLKELWQSELEKAFTLPECEIVKLGEVVEVAKGKVITKKQAIPGDFPVIAGGKNSPYSHNIFTHEECITASASGASAGWVMYHKKPIWASDCCVISLREGGNVMLPYVYWYLLSSKKILNALKQGSAQPHVYPKDIAKLLFPFVSIPEQKKIAAHLEAFQAEIQSAEALTQDQLKKIEELRQSILEKAFSGRLFEEEEA